MPPSRGMARSARWRNRCAFDAVRLQRLPHEAALLHLLDEGGQHPHSVGAAELTTVGRAFVHEARNVLNELDSALLGIQDVAEWLSGEVTLACVPSAVGYFLPRVFAEYCSEGTRWMRRTGGGGRHPSA